MERDTRLKDFRNFVYLCHRYIGLPDPTPLQYEICESIVDDELRLCIQAFRGASKSHLSALWCLWTLYWNNEEKILIISATADKASQFVKFCKDTILRCPFLKHMAPVGEQRNLAYSFDVAGCLPSQTPSLEAKGLTSQITGSRASTIIADDIEISTNSRSADAREKIRSLSAEFESIILPGGRILWLGTPHSASSVYNTLPAMGYAILKFPIYKDGKNVEPGRFPEEDLQIRRNSIGESIFRLQFMLDTALEDDDIYPLKLADLIIDDSISKDSCRESYRVTKTKYPFAISEAKGTDALYLSESLGNPVPYIKKVLALDPAGAGKDEFAWCILGVRNGYIFSIAHSAFDKYTDSTPIDIANLAKKYKVNEIVLESNFGDVYLESLIQPHTDVKITTVRSKTQKELRIISALEPVLNSHKLVVTKEFIEDKIMTSQFCNLTKDRGCLKHDDRLDALAIGVAHLVEYLRINEKQAIQNQWLDDLEKEFEDQYDIKRRRNPSWIP